MEQKRKEDAEKKKKLLEEKKAAGASGTASRSVPKKPDAGSKDDSDDPIAKSLK